MLVSTPLTLPVPCELGGAVPLPLDGGEEACTGRLAPLLDPDEVPFELPVCGADTFG